MSILFSDIYKKAIALFDDPKITIAYETNKVQFNKLMYTYLQNAISMFNNPVSIGMRLSNYFEPKGTMQVFSIEDAVQIEEDKVVFNLDNEFLIQDNSEYSFIKNGEYVKGKINKEKRTVEFYSSNNENNLQSEYAVEQYYTGEFIDNFSGFNLKNPSGDKLVVGEIKDILARLLVKSWAEEERNLLTDIRNVLQDSDFKLNANSRSLDSKNNWINQLNNEILQLQNRLAWNIRFMKGSTNLGRG